MNAPKFTPGPWVVREDAFDGFCVHAPTIEHLTSCGYVIASNVNGDEPRRPKYGTPKANASLIAAAPELYEALESLVHAVEAARWPLTAEQMVPLNTARAALAKAVTP